MDIESEDVLHIQHIHNKHINYIAIRITEKNTHTDRDGGKYVSLSARNSGVQPAVESASPGQTVYNWSVATHRL
jgi:hypothetical protein